MSKKKHTFTEIEFNNELSFYFFKELDAEGNLVETYEKLNKQELKEFRDNLIAESEGKKSAKKKNKERREEVDGIEEMVDSLISTFNGNNPEEAEEGSSNLPEKQSNVQPFNFKQNRNKSEIQAKGLLKSLLKFYLSEEYIAENDYIKAKIAIDQLTLAGLINQIRMSEHSIESLMESIDSGEKHPRMFEVLAGMQRVYIDLMKHQTLSVIAVEEHMKKLKDDFDYYQSKPVDAGENKKIQSHEDDEEGDVERGTRNFLKQLEDDDEDSNDFSDSDEDDISDAEIE